VITPVKTPVTSAIVKTPVTPPAPMKAAAPVKTPVTPAPVV